jgi:hypothetical protein
LISLPVDASHKRMVLSSDPDLLIIPFVYGMCPQEEKSSVLRDIHAILDQ